jgi:hypothetical protein
MSRSVRSVVAAMVGLVSFMWLPATPAQAEFFDAKTTYAADRYGESHGFFVGGGGIVMHIRPNGQWDNFGPIAAIGTPTAVLSCDGKLHVFVVSGANGHLYAKWQVTPGNVIWSHPWFDMGGYLTSNPKSYRNAQGRIEIFARGGDAAVWTRWQDSACGAWSSWTSIGGLTIDGLSLWPHDPTADGYKEVKTVGTDNLPWKAVRPCWTCSWVWRQEP